MTAMNTHRPTQRHHAQRTAKPAARAQQDDAFAAFAAHGDPAAMRDARQPAHR
jgi:hypothetical protein